MRFLRCRADQPRLPRARTCPRRLEQPAIDAHAAAVVDFHRDIEQRLARLAGVRDMASRFTTRLRRRTGAKQFWSPGIRRTRAMNRRMCWERPSID